MGDPTGREVVRGPRGVLTEGIPVECLGIKPWSPLLTRRGGDTTLGGGSRISLYLTTVGLEDMWPLLVCTLRHGRKCAPPTIFISRFFLCTNKFVNILWSDSLEKIAIF